MFVYTVKKKSVTDIVNILKERGNRMIHTEFYFAIRNVVLIILIVLLVILVLFCVFSFIYGFISEIIKNKNNKRKR